MVVVIEVGLSGENVMVVAHDGVLLSLISVTSASHVAASSSELLLNLSSTNSGADICDTKESVSLGQGKGMWGVSGLECAIDETGTGVSHILAS